MTQPKSTQVLKRKANAARILRSDQFRETIEKVQNLEDARQIIAKAEATASTRSQEIEREAVRRSSLMRTVTERDLRNDVLDIKRRTAITGAQEVLEAAARVHAKFDELTPWVEDLVVQSVERIIGQISVGHRLKLIVEQAIANTRSGMTFALRVSSEQFAEAKALPAMLVGTRYEGLITSVEIDTTAKPGTAILLSRDEALDVSLSTQLEMLRTELTQTLSASGSSDAGR